MTQIPYDQLAKEYLQELLSPLGQVERSFEIPGEPKFIDVWFQPDAALARSTPPTLLDRITTTPCAFEPFRNPPTRRDIRKCLLKLFWAQESELRADDSIPEDKLPVLWVLASTVSQPVLLESRGAIDPTWLPGIYFCGEIFKMVIVAIDQLPKTPETLWLRILGRDATQTEAIEEVRALPKSDPQRSRILQMLTTWKVRIDLLDPPTPEDEELRMALSQAYLEWEQATEQRGEQQGKLTVIHELLRARFGELDAELAAIAPQILALPAADYAALLLQLAQLDRAELLDRFANEQHT